MHAIWNIFLIKREVSSHKSAKRELSLYICISNIPTEFAWAGLKKQRTIIFKSIKILDKVDSEASNIYAPNMINKYENRPDNLDEMCLTDFAASYIYKKTDMNYKPDEEKDLKIAFTLKLKHGVVENDKKNLANYD